MPERDPHAIQHIACGRSDLFATAESETTVRIWSLALRCLVAEFPTNLDFGGRRLALVEGEDVRVVTGSYDREGVAAYDKQGRVLWHRKDLRKPQCVRSLDDPKSPRVAVGFDQGRGLVILDAESGATLESMHGTRAIEAVSSDLMLTESHKRVVALHSPERKTLWSAPLDSFAVLDAAVSSDAVAFSEAGGPVKCISCTGKRLWTWRAPRGSHALRVGWRPDADRWLLVSWPYQNGGDKNLVSIDRNGKVVATVCIGCPAETEFLDAGRYLVTSDGVILRTEDGSEAWRFYGPSPVASVG